MDGDHYAQFHIENGRTYYQTQCDYPGCDGGYEGTEAAFRRIFDVKEVE